MEVKIISAFIEGFFQNESYLLPTYTCLIGSAVVTATQIHRENPDFTRDFYKGYHLCVQSANVVAVSYKEDIPIGVAYPSHMSLKTARSLAHLTVEACNQFKLQFKIEDLPQTMFGFKPSYSQELQERFSILAAEPVWESRLIQKQQYENDQVWQDKPDKVSLDHPFIVNIPNM
jgi:hypothetical protein